MHQKSCSLNKADLVRFRPIQVFWQQQATKGSSLPFHQRADASLASLILQHHVCWSFPAPSFSREATPSCWCICMCAYSRSVGRGSRSGAVQHRWLHCGPHSCCCRSIAGAYVVRWVHASEGMGVRCINGVAGHFTIQRADCWVQCVTLPGLGVKQSGVTRSFYMCLLEFLLSFYFFGPHNCSSFLVRV